MGKYFRATSRAADEAEQSINNNSAVVGPVTAPMVVGDPVATGEPFVGYVLTCSEPTVTGGSNDCQFDYFWVDESNAMVWENTYMSNTCKVIDFDLGKKMKCLVTVTDKVTGENTTVASNELGPINRPTLADFDTWVDSELHDDPDADVGVAINGSVAVSYTHLRAHET